MGWGYTPVPIGELPADTVQWLETEVGLEIPTTAGVSRKPTAAEVRAAVESLSEYEVEVCQASESLDLDLTHKTDRQKRTTIWVKDYQSSEDQHRPVSLYFRKGDPETVVLVVERLARTCGPFVLMLDGESFTVVTAGTPANVEWTE